MNELEKVSYSLGINVANNVKSQGLTDLDVTQFAKAVADVYSKDSLAVSEAEANQILNEFFQTLSAKKEEKAKEEGTKFLAENKTKEGVVELPSGLQYKVLKEGEGTEKPSASSTVNTHYHGTLIDGTVFDSSVQRGEPISFPVNGVIAGWTEALQLMTVGAKWELYIPSDLAYGARGAGAQIGPHTTLIFQVELLGIQ